MFIENKRNFYGPFSNFTEASRFLNPNKHSTCISSHSNISKPIKRNCNLEHLVITEKGKVYIAYNPNYPLYRNNFSSSNNPICILPFVKYNPFTNKNLYIPYLKII